MIEGVDKGIKTIDRSQPPLNMPLLEMVWPVVVQERIEWAGGLLPVDLIESGGQDLVRIEWQFPAGSWHESKPLLASLTNRMLQEGSVFHNSKQIAERLDYYGAYLHHEGGVHRSMVGVYSLGKHLEAVLPLVWELIFQPTFPEQELKTTIQNRLQELSVSRNKVSFLSRNRLMGMLFGAQHPYGYSTREEDLLSVTAEDLRAFHRQFYTVDGLRLVVAGGTPAKHSSNYKVVVRPYCQRAVNLPCQGQSTQGRLQATVFHLSLASIIYSTRQAIAQQRIPQ